MNPVYEDEYRKGPGFSLIILESLTSLLFMTILAQALLTLVRCHLMTFTFFTAGQCVLTL